MIEKICARLEELFCGEYDSECVKKDDVLKIVQDVAKEYGNGWIPCSERLPEFPKSVEDEKYYLVTVKRNDGFTFWDKMIFHDYGWFVPGNCEVTAWQKVAPYQKGE